MKTLIVMCLSVAVLGLSPLTAQTPAPELDVTRPPIWVANGGQDTLGVDYVIGVNGFVWYWLQNNGNADLAVSPLAAPSGCVNCTATVTQQAPATIAPGTSTIVEIRVKPTVAGAFSFNVSIASDDADENPYDWTVHGNAIPAPAPEIEVSRAGTVLVSNVPDQLGSGHSAGSTVSLDYTASNLGTADLIFGQTYYSYSGVVNCSFMALQSIPAWPAYIGPGADDHYVLEITPLAPGPFSLLIHIPNNDSDEGPFKLRITGTAVAPTPAAISIHRQGQTIASGSSDPLGVVGLGSFSTTYTITNSGMLALNLSLPLAAPFGTSNAAAQIVSQPSVSSVAGGSSVTFTVEWMPLALGYLEFGLSVLSDAVNQPDFEWQLTATAAALPEFELAGATGQEIGNGSAYEVLRGNGGFSVTYRFVLTNTGLGALLLSGMPVVELTDKTNCQAFVSAMPAQNLASGEFAIVDIMVTPESDGQFGLRISIINNDADESAFWFKLDGSKGGPDNSGGPGCVAVVGAGQIPIAVALLGVLAVAAMRPRRRLKTRRKCASSR